jgi:putative component of membrane protein insertase Oxa1/YidC/SpoIIIJ protein YidD
MRDVTRFIDSSHYVTKKRSKGWTFRRLLSLIDRSLRSIAVALIDSYQRNLSPRKGYSCAHRIVFGGDSCSEYVKNVLTDKSLFETTLLARQRFRECNIASISSKNQGVESKNSAMVSVGPDSDPIFGCIFLIVGAILSLICGKGNSPCK